MTIQWALVVFKLFAGVGAGVLGFVGLAQLLGKEQEANRKAIILSLVLLLLAGCAALLQVGRPAGIMSVVRNLSLESPLSWELLSYGVAVIVSIVYLLLSKSNNALVKIVALAAIIMAVAVGFSTGYSHVSMIGMRSWHNPAIPACFLSSALLLGGLAYLVIRDKTDDQKTNKLIVTIIIALAIVATICFCIYGFTASLGDYALIYWALVPIVGGVISVASTLLMKMKDKAMWLYTGLIAALIGAVAFRAIIWSIVETGLRTGDSIVHI